MALGRHWEWRAFGSLSGAFRERFESLRHAMADRKGFDLVDYYLWVPGYGVNAKLRSGLATGDCLKLKRLRARWNQLQLWHEDPNDIYNFPLESPEFAWLAEELHIELPSGNHGARDFNEAQEVLKTATPQVEIIEVHKRRDVRVWEDSDAKVLVEIAEITKPEVISSICMESTTELTELSRPEELTAARDSVQRAVDDLGVTGESLQSMNYVDALTIWSNGELLRDFV